MHSIRFAVPVALILLVSGVALAVNVAPDPPANVQVTDRPNDDGNALYVSWDASPDDGAGDNDVVSYRVYKRLPGEASVLATEVTTVKKASYLVALTGLTAGQSYGVGVLAWDGSLQSSITMYWRTPVDNNPPRVPRNATVSDVAADNGKALLIEFDASLDDTAADREVTLYRIYRSTSASDTGTQVGTVTASQQASYEYTDTTVLPNRTYWYRLAAAGATGLSPFTTAVARMPIDNTPPAPPANFTVTDRPNDDGTALYVNFDKSPDEGAGARDVIRYNVYKRLSGQPLVKITEVGATGQASYVYLAGGLTPGTNYGFAVASWDGTSESTKSVIWRTPVDNTPPQPPRNVRVLDVANDHGKSLTVKFDNSVDDVVADPEVTQYQVWRSTVLGDNGARIATLLANRASTYTYPDNAVVPNQTYYYRIRSQGLTGLSAFTPPVNATPIDNRPPAPPTNTAVADRPNDDGNALLLSFNKSADDGAGARDVICYNVYQRLSGQPVAKVGEVAAAAKASYVYVVKDLTPGTSYGIAVAAFDGTSDSTMSFLWRTPVDDTAPRPPRNLAVEDWPDDDGSSVKVTFDASLDDTAADPEVRRYYLYRAASATGAAKKIGEVLATRAASYEFRNTGLPPGKTFWFWATAVGATGASARSNVASAAGLDNRPVRPPLNLTAKDRPYDNGGVIDLAWDRSGDDGVGLNHVVSYFVYRRMYNVVQDPTKIATVPATGTAKYNWSDTTVPMALVLYEYTVTAVSRGGVESVAAGPANAAATNNNVVMFQPPTNFKAEDVPNDSGGQIRLTWNRTTSESDPGGPPPPPLSVAPASEVTTQDNYGGKYEFYRRKTNESYTTAPTFIVDSAGTNDPMTYVDTDLTNGVRYYYKVRYRRYDQISNFTAEASAIPSSGSTSSSAAATEDDADRASAATLSARLVSPPQTVAVGQNADVAVVVSADGAASVCLEYSINGGGASRTRAVSGTGSFGTGLTLKTSHLAAGTIIEVRAVVTEGPASAASDTATMIVVSP